MHVYKHIDRARRRPAAVAGALLIASLACASSNAPRGDAETAPAEQTVAPLVRSAEQSRAGGDFDSAIQAYADAFGRTPWNTRLKRALAVTHTERAAAARSKGALGPAERDLRAALELYPDDQEFRHSLAVVLVERSAREPDAARAAAYLGEVHSLAPELKIPERMANTTVERRLDLAFELLERGQLDAGIEELEHIRRDFPRETSPTRLQAEALVRKASELSNRQNYGGAREALDKAVELYRGLAPCDGQRCDREELRVAHYNRVVAYLNLGLRQDARTALEEAQQQGLRFADLAETLAR
jgi:tetratricopeptide (TPR) repeat protein